MMEIKWSIFDKDPLAVGQNNYLTKIVNVYIVYDLDIWTKILQITLSLRFAYLEQRI